MSSLPSNYGFVPLTDTVRWVKRKQADHSGPVDGTLTGTVDLELRAVEPVHVGSGFKRLVGGRVVRGHVRSGGTPVIPGSSVRGLVRSRYEAITKSCSPVKTGKKNKEKIRSRTHGNTEVELPHNVAIFSGKCGGGRGNGDDLCPACALFGTMGIAGRLAFFDLAPTAALELQTKQVPSQWGPRVHHCGTYRKESNRDKLVMDNYYGRKFYPQLRKEEALAGERKQAVEVIPAGSSLSGEVAFKNLTGEELGGLFAALGHTLNATVRVGAYKGGGFGCLKVTRCAVATRGGAGVDGAEHYVAAFKSSEDFYQEGFDALINLRRAEEEPS